MASTLEYGLTHRSFGNVSLWNLIKYNILAETEYASLNIVCGLLTQRATIILIIIWWKARGSYWNMVYFHKYPLTSNTKVSKDI